MCPVHNSLCHIFCICLRGIDPSGDLPFGSCIIRRAGNFGEMIIRGTIFWGNDRESSSAAGTNLANGSECSNLHRTLRLFINKPTLMRIVFPFFRDNAHLRHGSSNRALHCVRAAPVRAIKRSANISETFSDV